jgi:hypothetical protein
MRTKNLLMYAAVGGAAYWLWSQHSAGTSTASVSGLGDSMPPLTYWAWRRAMKQRGLPDYNSSQRYSGGQNPYADGGMYASPYGGGMYAGADRSPYGGGGWQPPYYGGGGMYSGAFPVSAVEMESPGSIAQLTSQIDAGSFV